MSELQIIETALEQAARRRRWARALRGLWYGLLIGAVLSLLVAGTYHLTDLPLWAVLGAGFLPLPCMLIGLIIGGWRTVPLKQVARWVDGQQHLKERLSTALEVSDHPETGRWRDLIINDAAEHAKSLNAREMVPLHLPRAVRWAVATLALVVGLGFVPEYRSKASIQKKADERNIKEVAKQLADLTRRDLAKRTPTLEPIQKSMDKVTELGDQMSKQTLTRSEALKDLANVAEKLKEQLQEMGKDPALKRLEQAARASTGNDAQTAAGLQKQMDSLQKQIGSPTGNPDALDKMKKDLQKLQQAAQGLSDKSSPEAEAERKKIAEALAALSKQAQEMGLQLPQLDDAINALQANNPDLVLKDIEAATTDLEKMRDMAKSLQQLQQQMEKIGKDLAEQLKNGQPEAAQQTLQKMSDQLKTAQLTPEQLKKLLEDVRKAVDPAGNYGKVADLLKEASKKMQGDDKSGASKSLADAAQELKKLMEQMGDSQELAATLENLNKASMCIGSCQGWGQCKNPGFNPNGKGPGSGVGTWSDSSAEWNGESTAGWDNSDINRPDMEGRGVTDRGDGELSDALKPTKVKGTFSPGGQMPSITLKGVSIKGQSKVDYEAAAAAAQSDAQSALSQEKVPRAYQGAVKDYFDDLKK
jgi:predicted  nucleic acid-binding Zn-ribbon protein